MEEIWKRAWSVTVIIEAGSSGSENSEPIIQLHEAIWCTEDRGYNICRKE